MQEDNWEVEAPQFLHKPFQFLFWESDELAIIILMLTAAMLLDSYVWWLLSFVVPFIYTKFKRSYPRGFLKHMLYYFGFSKFPNYPPARHTEYYE